jgi:hypothetical protein
MFLSLSGRAGRLRWLVFTVAWLFGMGAWVAGGVSHAEVSQYDVVVYGGTSAGVTAAIQVRRMGKSVVLIEPGQHLGGLTTSGLGWTDAGDKAVIGGLAREFYQRIKRHYDQPKAWVYQQASQYDRYRPQEDAMWTFEPHVAQRIIDDWVTEQGVVVRRGQRLDRHAGVRQTERRITSIRMESGETYVGQMFIDATYEGDLMAAAGVSYTVGRESNAVYGETLNGVALRQNTHNHRFLKKVDPYRTPGDPQSGLLPGVHGESPGAEGSGDHRIQAYCYRLCMSNVPANRVPFPKPKNYDPLRYELLLRNFEAGDLRVPLSPDRMPNGKTDTNNNGAFSTDYIGMNYDYPEADYARREAILAEHRDYQQGLMWTLANHPRVPTSVREKMAVWGLAADEFVGTDNWPHQIYVREARRMVSDYIMTELDCRRVRVLDDSVGMGSYNMDSHNVQRFVTAEGGVQNEGDVQVSPGGAYLISYRSIIPKQGETENLCVPVCLAASHIAYGSIRMEPVFMVLGQSAATAAVQALEAGSALQVVEYPALKARLLADRQVLTWPGKPPAERVIRSAAQLPGWVVDDDEAKVEGVWIPSSSSEGYIGQRYLHDNHELKGTKSIRFTFRAPSANTYEIRLSYTPHANRATNVPVVIKHAQGTTRVLVNQRLKPSSEDGFVSLGTFACERGENWVEITTTDTDGHVIADAVQWLLATDASSTKRTKP